MKSLQASKKIENVFMAYGNRYHPIFLP